MVVTGGPAIAPVLTRPQSAPAAAPARVLGRLCIAVGNGEHGLSFSRLILNSVPCLKWISRDTEVRSRNHESRVLEQDGRCCAERCS